MATLGPDVPADIGYLTVSGQAIRALADSSDSGSQPDAELLNGTVTFAPVNLPNRPYLVHGVNATVDMYVLPGIQVCRLVNGELLPPDPDMTETDVRLIAPLQVPFDYIDWYWRATFVLTDNTTWSVNFTGNPGTTIILPYASWLSNLEPPNPITQTWVQVGTTIPAAATVGQFLLDTATGELYKIGA